ncbi:unnamed protein product [Adineta steineri]|uniref:EGF-like domain-containing protein n=1 Tax=Adineta steineri TaxID=433720 RepID=A0A814LLY2_9BILA|nr:unnamed protein product [Adineta steineri]CAF3939818.1 unnamed protein product [Adineta steineri]
MVSMIIVAVLYSMTMYECRIFLYNTENSAMSEQFDCIYEQDDIGYDIGSVAGTTLYCRRAFTPGKLERVFDKCENDGQKKSFVKLLNENVSPNEVLEWSSSIEAADNYAALYYTNHSLISANDLDQFLCHCKHPTTFGKYCEYKLTFGANSLKTSHVLQATARKAYRPASQVEGKVLCYVTLLCDWNLPCLDWRDICDGEQQCENGWDEEHCDKLEFNECENDEFRCMNGMCIPEEYWLDGDVDCMDWTDENYKVHLGGWCFHTVNAGDCDEHWCLPDRWSCGDGQCIYYNDRLIFMNIEVRNSECWNYRHMYYMCEMNSIEPLWTLEDGRCWPYRQYDDPQYSKGSMGFTDIEICTYLIRCALSDGFEIHCPCNRLNCSYIMREVCIDDYMYEYPIGPLIHPYMRTMYYAYRDFTNKVPDELILFGGIRCRGYYGIFNSSEDISVSLLHLNETLLLWDSEFCLSEMLTRDYNSSIKYDENCWINSFTFNGYPYGVFDVCSSTQECISQYRINDGKVNCLYDDDESFFLSEKNLCSRVRKHRFQCSVDEATCYHLYSLGGGTAQCSNRYDEYLYGTGRSLFNLQCAKHDLSVCHLLKEYIENSSIVSNSSTNSDSFDEQKLYQLTNRIPFQMYCDSNWNLHEHVDEIPPYCQSWICHSDQYQCRSGPCIPLKWVCDGQWDCADASDEETILFIDKWSSHNAKLENLTIQRNICAQLYSNIPFAQLCNTTKSFPCLRANVSNPLDLKQNIPCIPYEKVGDGIEDCYNAYDEKNTFALFNGIMWGFALQCKNETIPYSYACYHDNYDCVKILCSHKRSRFSNCTKITDAICIDDDRCVPNGRCDGKRDCSYGEDEYWCAPKSYKEQMHYRLTKHQEKNNYKIFGKQIFPPLHNVSKPILTFSTSRLTNVTQKTNNKDISGWEYSFICDKGVAVINGKLTVCFCPPSYYGSQCQFHSDRLTIITHLDLTTWPESIPVNWTLPYRMPKVFKIHVKLLFNEITIDNYEFHSNPLNTIFNSTKHKFYLIYSRSKQMMSLKRMRYSNRSDILINHPYSVHFDVYALYSNESIPLILGSWHYPIYFDFLPAFRLATVLRFPKSFFNISLDPCKAHTCPFHSLCKPIFNRDNSYFCSCENGFYGENCSKHAEICDTYCALNTICRVTERSVMANTDNPLCICPLYHFGQRCHLRFSQCDINPCLNNGTCLYTYDAVRIYSLLCVCTKFFYGDRCQNEKMDIQIKLNLDSIDKLPRASVIQFYDVDPITYKLLIQHQQVIDGLPFSISYSHGQITAPPLAIIKLYWDFIPVKYFVLYIQPNKSSINIITSPEYCPLSSHLLQKGK